MRQRKSERDAKYLTKSWFFEEMLFNAIVVGEEAHKFMLCSKFNHNPLDFSGDKSLHGIRTPIKNLEKQACFAFCVTDSRGVN